jgi:hypothetical protein
MFLHIGRDMIVRFDEIIGIFDIEKTSTSRISCEYLSPSPDKEIISVTEELPKSFIVCRNGLKTKNYDQNKTKVYISQISSATLLKRLKSANSQSDLLRDKGIAEG